MRFLNLQNKIHNASYLDFGRILDNCIDLYKKIWLKGFLLVLIIAVITFGLIILFEAIGLGMSSFTYDRQDGFGFSSLYSGSNIIYSLPQTIIASTISIGLLGGFYRICKHEDLNEVERDDFFYFFKGGHFSKILMLGIIYALIASVAQLLLFLPYIFVYVPLSFFAIFLANNPDLNEIEIIKLSFQLGVKKWFVAFGLMFITGIIGMVGMLACGIGVLFTISIAYLPVYFIYRDVIGFDDDDEIQKIGTNL